MNRIQDKLLIILITIAIAPLLVTDYLTIKSAEQAQASDNMDALDSILSQKITQVDQHIVVEQERAQLLANTPQIILSLPIIISNFNQGENSSIYRQEIAKIQPFITYFQQSAKLHNVYIIASDGTIVYAVRRGKDFGTNLISGAFDSTQLASVVAQVTKTNQTAHSEFTPYAGDNDIFSAFVAAPIFIDDQASGVIALQLTPEILYAITQDYTALQNTGETLLAKLDGDQAVFISPLRFNSLAPDEVRVRIDSVNGRPIQEAVLGISGKGYATDYRDIEIIAAWRYLQKYNLGMVVKIDKAEAFKDIARRRLLGVLIALAIILPFICIAYFIARRVTAPIIEMVQTTNAIAHGDFQQYIPIRSRDEIGQLEASINEMSSHIRRALKDKESKRWLQDGIDSLYQTIRVNQMSSDLADNIVAFIASYLDAKVGSLYVVTGQQLTLTGGYAFVPQVGKRVIELGDGLIGQVAQSKTPSLLSQLPEDYVSISSSIGEIQPGTLLIYPLIRAEQIIAVIELGWLDKEHSQAVEYLDSIGEFVATALGVDRSAPPLRTLLEQSQQQVEALQQKVEYLDTSCRYKSKSLVNMSHEIRTPLNSMLVLSRILSDNVEGNLNQDQVESAKIIHRSGRELLSLITDILDLSKIEAGKMKTCLDAIPLSDIMDELNGQFKAIASEKNLTLSVDIDHQVPDSIVLDVQKTQQILKNLLSNALKFTDSGYVKLHAGIEDGPPNISTALNSDGQLLAISVTDSGIGISRVQQRSIFESFQQACDSTSRQYGGTGLGLTISRQLSALIGAELELVSEENCGSTFTLYLPLTLAESFAARPTQLSDSAISEPSSPQGQTIDEAVAPQGQTIDEAVAPQPQDEVDTMTANGDNRNVIIEDNPGRSKTLAQLPTNSGIKCAIVTNDLQGVEYVKQYQPRGVIPEQANSTKTLAKGAARYHQRPIANQQIQQILSQLRQIGSDDDNAPAQLDLIICSASGDDKALDWSFAEQQATKIGQVGSLNELSQRLADDCDKANGIIISLDAVTTEIEQWLNDYYYSATESDAVIILYLEQQPATNLLRWLEQLDCHVIIYGGQSTPLLTNQVTRLLSRVDTNLISNIELTIGENATDFTPEQLSDDKVAVSQQPTTSIIVPSQRENDSALANALPEQAADALVNGCYVLLVDDDLRNTFALSKVLNEQGMKVILADNGTMALEKLAAVSRVDIVLMDIMMPVMDGYEAMRKIRAHPQYQSLPIIALTAKTMREDHRKCVEAGASDYLTKPVDLTKLIAMMRVWLYQEIA